MGNNNTSLLVGFDSAWTARKSGALVGVLRSASGGYEDLGPPQISDFKNARQSILDWQSAYSPGSTIVMLDQPCIVQKSKGQRPVEHIVGSAVSLRYGGMQPASLSRQDMFGVNAPMWPFLGGFGGPGNPFQHAASTSVFETYPVLALIAWGWMLPDSQRSTGRLPKYNPERRKTFSTSDWKHVPNRKGSCGGRWYKDQYKRQRGAARALLGLGVLQ
jgi:predicted RNase H-like nuclease